MIDPSRADTTATETDDVSTNRNAARDSAVAVLDSDAPWPAATRRDP
jgi:hypothetical protein